MKIAALAGGVGGAKFADGLAQILSPEELVVIVNTGDDFIHLGLNISPDLDTMCYTLAKLANPITGWGLEQDTFNMLEALAVLGTETWFKLGDRDLATHLERTHRLKAGESLSEITKHFCRAWNVRVEILPMSNDPVHTLVDTIEYGELPFQQYFVKYQYSPRVKGFRYDGIEFARPAPGVLDVIQNSDAIIICPSNPWVSIDPILAIQGIRSMLRQKRVVAISPIVKGKAIRGPAAKMFLEMGICPSALAVASHFDGLLAGFTLDTEDRDISEGINETNVRLFFTNTLMHTRHDRMLLAQNVLNFTQSL